MLYGGSLFSVSELSLEFRTVKPASRIQVLLIEDDRTFAFSVEKALGLAKKASFSVEHAPTLEKGLLQLAEQAFDIVLLDLRLPDCVGLKSVKRILERVSRAPVVVMTGEDEALAIEALQLGVQDYIQKGDFDLRSLERVILYSVERHELLREMRDQRDLLNRRTMELESSNADFASMGYMLSHDLSEPLRMVSSYLNLLGKKAGDRLSEKEMEYLNIAKDGSERMSILIKDLFEYSQIDRVQAKSKVVLGSVLDEVQNNLRMAIKESGANLRIIDLPVVLGSKSQFLILFQNLVGNALRYRKPDVAPEIEIKSVQNQNNFLITIADNGIGIDPKFSQEIFELFRRLHALDDYPGTGIGLATCKKIVERHGGKIWVESQKEVGSTFSITLPQLPPAEE